MSPPRTESSCLQSEVSGQSSTPTCYQSYIEPELSDVEESLLRVRSLHLPPIQELNNFNKEIPSLRVHFTAQIKLPPLPLQNSCQLQSSAPFEPAPAWVSRSQECNYVDQTKQQNMYNLEQQNSIIQEKHWCEASKATRKLQHVSLCEPFKSCFALLRSWKVARRCILSKTVLCKLILFRLHIFPSTFQTEQALLTRYDNLRCEKRDTIWTTFDIITCLIDWFLMLGGLYNFTFQYGNNKTENPRWNVNKVL